jgi:hypothetical protein
VAPFREAPTRPASTPEASHLSIAALVAEIVGSTTDTMPPAINGLGPAVVTLTDSIRNLQHELHASFVKFVQSLAQATDAKAAALSDWIINKAFRAGVTLEERQAFHIFCHTYGTWMRRYGGLDLRGLVGTDRWKDIKSTARYAHVVPSEEAQRAALLPEWHRPKEKQR